MDGRAPTRAVVQPLRGRGLAVVLRCLAVPALVFGFLVAIKLLGGSIAQMGKDPARSLFSSVSNPFAGLAVGVLATVLVQSSSTTTATIVGFVGSGAMALDVAVPMVMGANVGTTVTNTLVSIGHVRRSQEFQRAFAAATMHDFFNLLCVAILLPFELATGMLSRSAVALTGALTGGEGAHLESPVKVAVGAVYGVVVRSLEALGLTGTPLALALLVAGLGLTIACLLMITRVMRVLVSGTLERALNRVLGRAGWIGVLVGVAITVAVQSSSITTSLLVPMCAAGVLSLESAFPIMLGANIGTTLTALLASMAADSSAGLSIALVHVLFNVTGVVGVYLVPGLRRIPIRLASGLAAASARNPLWLVLYVVGVFVALPLAGWLAFRSLGG